ncbi:MAG TPA: hypothetical protein VNF28_00355 [Candidatus Binataceae bacterium]|nr:hypothetical protein [Candidatus Binataceae bacterium]
MDISYCGHLAEAMTQMRAKNFQRFKISLSDLALAHRTGWSSNCASPANLSRNLFFSIIRADGNT